MDIVVILGKRLNDDASMTIELENRLNLGIETLYKVNADYIAVTGGMPNRKAKTTEASRMYDYLLDKGIDRNKIIIENKSLTTYGNAYYLKKKIKGMKIDNIYLISSKYHFFRPSYENAQNIFRKRFKNINIVIVYKDEE